VAATFLGNVFSVSAAGLRDIFDAKYYADNNADLKEAYGYDEEKLFDHFMNHGLAENRIFSPILNVAEYRAAYADLEEAFGDDWDAYVNHFFTAGAYEKRDEGVLFNPVLYAEAYGDVAEAYGSDVVAITKHYMTAGIEENRTKGTAEGYESLAKKNEAANKANASAPTISGGNSGQ